MTRRGFPGLSSARWPCGRQRSWSASSVEPFGAAATVEPSSNVQRTLMILRPRTNRSAPSVGGSILSLPVISPDGGELERAAEVDGQRLAGRVARAPPSFTVFTDPQVAQCLFIEDCGPQRPRPPVLPSDRATPQGRSVICPCGQCPHRRCGIGGQTLGTAAAHIRRSTKGCCCLCHLRSFPNSTCQRAPDCLRRKSPPTLTRISARVLQIVLTNRVDCQDYPVIGDDHIGGSLPEPGPARAVARFTLEVARSRGRGNFPNVGNTHVPAVQRLGTLCPVDEIVTRWCGAARWPKYPDTLEYAEPNAKLQFLMLVVR